MLFDLVVEAYEAGDVISEGKVVSLSSEAKGILLVAKEEGFFEALLRAWVFNNSISISYWSDRLEIKNWIALNAILVKANVINVNVIPQYNWGECSLNEQFLIDQGIDPIKERATIKMVQYSPRDVEIWEPDKRINRTRSNGSISNIGLIRKGFVKAAQVEFTFDREVLVKYKEFILINMSKGIKKTLDKYPEIKQDEVNYNNIAHDVFEHIVKREKFYTLEGVVSDSRGRAVYLALQRVFNPITYKDARASLIWHHGKWIKSTNEVALKDVYLFIAELLGFKEGSWEEKAKFGFLSYFSKKVPENEPDKDKDGYVSYPDLHEIIWLERIYSKLDELFNLGEVYWDIPIELDATASMAQIMGVLLNDTILLDYTNVVNSQELKDFWETPERVRRTALKAVWTPRLYGSSATESKLIKDKGLKEDPKETEAIKKTSDDPKFKLASLLRDINIQYSNINKPEFEIKIWNETFYVEVNKFKPYEAKLKAYKAIDNNGKVVAYTNHEVVKVPDYDKFRYFLHTLLIHNLDSQVADYVVNNANCDVISIHDAFLTMPGSNVRELYMEQLAKIRANGWNILVDYWKSIGLQKGALQKIQELKDSITKCNLSIEVSCLK